MDQTLDLRKKEELVPPAPEPVSEPQPEPIEHEVLEAEPMKWSTHVSPPPHPVKTTYAVIILIIAAVLVAVLAHDFLFTIVLAMSAFVLTLHKKQPHHPKQVHVHATGISIDDTNHRYSEMKSFWIRYNPPYVKELSVEFKKGLEPLVKIPLEDQNPLEVRQAMISYVPEKEHELTFLDHLVRWIGI